VVPKWASQWKKLGIQLKLAHYLMDNIELDYHNDGCESCCSKTFAEWLDSNPVATWNDIITALDELAVEGMCVHSCLNT